MDIDRFGDVGKTLSSANSTFHQILDIINTCRVFENGQAAADVMYYSFTNNATLSAGVMKTESR